MYLKDCLYIEEMNVAGRNRSTFNVMQIMQKICLVPKEVL